jgi:hypothetical protein
MAMRLGIGLLFLLLSSAGCRWSEALVNESGDPEASEVMLAHWAAVQRREWKSAYDRLHPDLKTAKFSLRRFAEFHSRRLKARGFPHHDIKVAGSERIGEDVVVSFDVISVPAGGGEPVAVPPRRRATLRRSGGSWGLMTHDLLAIRP